LRRTASEDTLSVGNHFEGVAQALARVHTRGNLGAREIRPPFSDSVLHHIFFL
jgi:hypothetical protein